MDQTHRISELVKVMKETTSHELLEYGLNVVTRLKNVVVELFGKGSYKKYYEFWEFVFAVFLLSIGIFIMLLSVGISYKHNPDDDVTGDLGMSKGMGVMAMPLFLPFLLVGTLITARSVSKKSIRENKVPYMTIAVAEILFVVGMIPYPVGFFHESEIHWNKDFDVTRITVEVEPLFYWSKYSIPFFEILLNFAIVLLFAVGWLYLLRPEMIPLSEANKKMMAEKTGETKENPVDYRKIILAMVAVWLLIEAHLGWFP